jgi:hypothetical protein
MNVYRSSIRGQPSGARVARINRFNRVYPFMGRFIQRAACGVLGGCAESCRAAPAPGNISPACVARG